MMHFDDAEIKSQIDERTVFPHSCEKQRGFFFLTSGKTLSAVSCLTSLLGLYVSFLKMPGFFCKLYRKYIFEKYFLLGLSDSTVARVFALHVTDSGSVPEPI